MVRFPCPCGGRWIDKTLARNRRRGRYHAFAFQVPPVNRWSHTRKEKVPPQRRRWIPQQGPVMQAPKAPARILPMGRDLTLR